MTARGPWGLCCSVASARAVFQDQSCFSFPSRQPPLCFPPLLPLRVHWTFALGKLVRRANPFLIRADAREHAKPTCEHLDPDGRASLPRRLTRTSRQNSKMSLQFILFLQGLLAGKVGEAAI
jgi:hypothetical protein